MRQRTRLLAMFGLRWLLAGCQPAGPLTAADVQWLKNDADQWVKAAKAADWAKLASLYATDGTLMPPNAPTVAGRDKIQAWMAAFPKLQDIKLAPQQIEGRGDLAYVRGTYTLTLAPQGNAPAISDNGKYLEIYKKQPDGKWTIVHVMFSSDAPAAPPPQAAKPSPPAKKE